MDAEEIRSKIVAFVAKEEGNSLSDGQPCFDEPLVGFADAEDPIFHQYKTIIGDFHRTPQEILPAAKTVIVWVLPIAAAARLSNRRGKEFPSLEWAWTRLKGEDFNVLLRQHVLGFLQEQGYLAAAPQLQESWQLVKDSPVGLASTWSERHAAYAAGLGTFSLSDSLITPRGSAHRVGSVVTNLALEPTPRPYRHHQENCLHFRGVECNACARRCPVGAITAAGHDKQKCREHVFGAKTMALYGLGSSSCGYCQTGVPCEARVPKMPQPAEKF